MQSLLYDIYFFFSKVMNIDRSEGWSKVSLAVSNLLVLSQFATLYE